MVRGLLLAASAAAAFWVAGGLNRRLARMRAEYAMVPGSPLENSPPLVSFTTVALGGFRGVLADLLWMRASRLKAEGHYFELMQLAEWITDLEPRFPEVWVFHAWNMAYNVSVLFENPEDRWRWVQHGIELLRDKGIVYNPGEARLYRELGWIFQHKIGGTLDRAHWHYKRRWAARMELLFDGPLPDFARLREAARTRLELLRDAEVRNLVKRLKEAGLDPFGEKLLDARGLPAPAAAVLEEAPAAAARLRAYVRRETMVRKYKLLPEVMQEIEQRYGPLDWRLPQAHAVYWAYRGRRVARGYELLACDRMIYQSLGDAFRRGRLFEDRKRGIFLLRPNLALLPRIRKVYAEALERHPGDKTVEGSYANFMRDAAVLLYGYGRIEEARGVYRDLKRHGWTTAEESSFRGFIYSSAVHSLRNLSSRNVAGVVEGALFQAYLWRSMGDEQMAEGFDRLAELCWREYMRSHAAGGLRERNGLPPLQSMRRSAIERVREMMTGSVARVRAGGGS